MKSIRERIDDYRRRAATAVLRLLSANERLLGVQVIDVVSRAHVSPQIRTVGAALELIAHYSPVLLRRISKHLDAIVINNTRTGYLPRKRLCILSSEKLAKGSVEEAALALAHEGTHAVLHQAGFAYEGSERERIEHACVRAEIRLARKLPNGDVLIEHLLKKLGLVWWEDEQLHRGRESDLRAGGVPEWVIRLLRLARR